MDFATELNKPIFICHPEHMYASCTAEVVSEAIANQSAVRGRFMGRLLLKASAARRLSRKALISVDQARPMELQELVVHRLESERDETFEYIDGQQFSGVQAAMEVCKRSVVGQFFFEMEKEALRLAQAAFSRGDFEPIETRRFLALLGPRAVLQLPWA